MTTETSEARIGTRAATIIALLSAAYVAAQILADVSSLKITDFFGLAMDGGTLVYPFTFTLRDLVHKTAGKRVARALIFAAAVINLLMALLFWIVARLPQTAGAGLPTELFGDVLAPVWRIVFASILAEVISELVDTEVYSAWVRRFHDRAQWGRVLVSNGIAVPIDSVVFAIVAFAGAIPAADVREIIVANIIIKAIVTIVSVPWIYMVKPGALVEEE